LFASVGRNFTKSRFWIIEKFVESKEMCEISDLDRGMGAARQGRFRAPAGLFDTIAAVFRPRASAAGSKFCAGEDLLVCGSLR
jgi:hypothetical protein